MAGLYKGYDRNDAGNIFSESFSILDTVTKLNNREAFLEELRILSETRNIKSGCLATFHINGINQLNNILGLDNSKSVFYALRVRFIILNLTIL